MKGGSIGLPVASFANHGHRHPKVMDAVGSRWTICPYLFSGAIKPYVAL
jgi:hypothetical protein